MFGIGIFQIGKYILYISEPPFSNVNTYGLKDTDKILNLEFYNVRLVEVKQGWHIYVDIVKRFKDKDKYFDFHRPIKNINNEKEIMFWSGVKDQSMPTYYLHKTTVIKLIELIQNEHSKENIKP